MAGLKLVTPDGYLPGVPFLVRVEVRNPAGDLDKGLWNAEATLSSTNPNIILSTNLVMLRNGLGTVLLTITGNSAFTLRARVNQETAARTVQNRASVPVTLVSGTLPGISNHWSGVVNITGDLTVPAGQILTINPGTIITVAGDPSGSSSTRLMINGAIHSLGTELQPITISSADAGLNWGQIVHENAQDSIYAHTLISKAGRAPGAGHTGAGPAFRVNNSTVVLESAVISDLSANGSMIGKIMMASGSSLTIRDSVLARARMGPEIASTGLLCTNSYIMEMNGPDDADGIYLHDSGTRALAISGCVFAGGDDDAIDTLDSTVTVENCILRDWANPNEDAKGVSAFNGEVSLRRCLIANCFAGVSAKSNGRLAILRIDHCTINGIDKGVSAATKANANAGNINIFMTNTIVRAADAVHSDFGADRFVSLTYCNLNESWPGAGNISADPLFVNAASSDFHLQPGSPCINAGDPGHPLDADQSRTDIGFHVGHEPDPAIAANLPPIMINEIMYHPASEETGEEYIELYNRSKLEVDLTGWRFSDGIRFTFTNASMAAGSYLVVAADVAIFRSKYPNVTNVVGNWAGTLSNSREDIDLDDARGSRVDSVRYADEGDWAQRQRGSLDRGHRGWGWFAEHDGAGKSAECINPNVSNNNGQNWASSVVVEGTPGAINSALRAETAPLIENVTHSPVVPRSTDSVVVTATIARFSAPAATVVLNYRVDRVIPDPFATVSMHDDGQSGDALSGDGIFSVVLPAQTNNAVVEFFVTASDWAGNIRHWPSPAMASMEGDPGGQRANALYQVGEIEAAGSQPIYKLIMTEVERAELQAIGDNAGGAANSDAQMNATFISIDGTGTDFHYLTGVRNRGHGTRARKPNNFRVNFRSDDEWKDVLALNINGQYSWLQVFGSALNLKSGIVGAYSRAVQVRVNNANLTLIAGIDRTHGSYAANEVIDADWSDRHFPNDGEGNVYRAIRDLLPPEFDYRAQTNYPSLSGGENKDSYTNTWFKTTNISEDDWSDLIGMLRVMGLNGTEPFTPENVRRVINVEQWMQHLAVMNLLGNAETGLNGGYNDDYFMYRGVNDPRFVLMYYDLDQILGFNGSFGPTGSLFSATNNQGAGRAIGRFLREPEFQPLYFDALRGLIETSFSAPQFNALVDQVLGEFVPMATRTQLKNWMETRRNFVLAQIPAVGPVKPPRAIVSAPPRSPTPRTSAPFQVSGEGITHYRYMLNDAPLSDETEVQIPITLSGLPDGTNTLSVIGKGASGLYQSLTSATTISWIVNRDLPGVRLNEVLASRGGNPRDQIEIFNEGASAVELAGLRLSDDLSNPNKFTLAAGSLAPGAYLVLDASQLGFSLDGTGESVYFFNRAAAGGGLLDSVEFGMQISDFSIGRLGESGEWFLTKPTLGAVNAVQAVGDPRAVRINEWLASGISPYADDFIELFNPELLPVAIGGNFLTDQRAGAPRQNRIAPLSFVPARGQLALVSGNGNSADEINFVLAAEQGEITLFSPELKVIDSVIYGPQWTGISMGRCPDGEPPQKPLLAPTPGGPNQCPVEPAPPQLVTLLPFDHVWRYDASGVDLGMEWKETAFDDSGWSSGPGVLGFENAQLSEPILTPISNTGATTYYFRAYFEVDPAVSASRIEVTHIIDDGAAFYLNGQEIGTRFNLSPGATAGTFALDTVDNANYQTFALPADNLRSGLNLLAVEVHQANAGSGDMVLGVRLDALVLTNIVSPPGVVINEILVRNLSYQNGTGQTPGWIELHNPSSNSVDLAGLGLTRDAANPAMWVFPAGAVIASGGYLIVECDDLEPASGINTGFSLSPDGGAVFLYDSPAEGGAIRGAVTYGLQAVDASVGLIPDGGANWALNIPTPGGANRAALLGDPARLKINEWVANPASGGDWFEIFNPNQEPVSLEGLTLSDSLATPAKHRLPKLSFLGTGASGFLELIADNDPAAGANHVNFALNADGEVLVLSDARGLVIDAVSFGPQIRGVSEGFLPDGSLFRSFFPLSASPGGPNFLPTVLGVRKAGGGVELQFTAEAAQGYELLVTESLHDPWEVFAGIPARPERRLESFGVATAGRASYFKVQLK